MSGAPYVIVPFVCGYSPHLVFQQGAGGLPSVLRLWKVAKGGGNEQALGDTVSTLYEASGWSRGRSRHVGHPHNDPEECGVWNKEHESFGKVFEHRQKAGDS